jgi:site-specific DNA recombinase
MKRITKIEENRALSIKKKTRVVAYCRVSTASDEQLISLDTQKAHYEDYIKSNAEWEFAGIFYDEGITGTKKECRDGLNSLVAACEKGLVNMIITKSISRFSRNTTDCLELVRKLISLNVTVIFEKENINTGSMESELMLSILSSLAESESVSISENSKWSIQKRFQNGTYIISYPPYGYENVGGEMIVVPEQAEIVKKIFEDTLAGKSTHAIAKELNDCGVTSKKGGKWTPGAINAIIRNEKFTGDVIFQKTYTDSQFSRHTNDGELNQYLCENHHEPIVSHEIFDKANEVLNQRGREKRQWRANRTLSESLWILRQNQVRRVRRSL